MLRRKHSSVAIGLATASLVGCATTPNSCRDLSGVRAVVEPDANGTSRLGYVYADDGSRVRHLHCRADQGEQGALLELAKLFEVGIGVPLDSVRAAGLYELAAATTPPRTAIYSPPVTLGGSGRVIFINNPNARTGSPEAMFRLGRMYLEGRGVTRDHKRGEALIEQARKQGFEASGDPRR